jgi:uncharacterized protein YaaW (UPF0174 family)
LSQTTDLLAVHGAILTAASAAYYWYSDRSDRFEKSFKGFNDTLAEVTRQVAVNLAEHLRPVFENAGSVTSLILDPSGEHFQEHPINPIGSEAYREAITSFAKSEFDGMVDLKNLIQLRDKWLSWARVMSWTILLALAVEGVVTTGIFIVGKMISWPIEVSSGIRSLFPPLVAFLILVGAAIRMTVLHDRLVELRKRYANP